MKHSFRVWDVGERVMVYFNSCKRFGFINHELDASIASYGAYEMLFTTDPEKCIWMQSPGHKDIDGREIFEGDVATMFDANGDEYASRLIVRYIEKRAAFEYEHTNPINAGNHVADISYFSMELPEPGWEVQVIGNIHENPELLEKGMTADASDKTPESSTVFIKDEATGTDNESVPAASRSEVTDDPF